MLRSQVVRPLFKSLTKTTTSRITHNASIPSSRLLTTLSARRPTVLAVANLRPLQYYATLPYDKINTKEEAKLQKEKLPVDPEHVSLHSAEGSHLVEHPLKVGEEDEKKVGAPGDAGDADMFAGIRSDMATIKETFALNHVPKETLLLGGAGLLPYLATSLSTVYLAYDINHAKAHGEGYLFSPEQAQQLLAHIEPIQIGYGAVIISFLGAIHWGLEYAKYGGVQGYPRYAIGVVAPAIAWPTLLLPIEYALITQFLAFNFLYFVDARATVRAWCPPWYSTYRFVLTFIVGASIVVSLIGRGQIAQGSHSLPGPADKMKELRDSQWENLEKEERERRKALAEEESDDEDEEEDEEESDDDSNPSGATPEGGEDADSETVEKENALQAAQDDKMAGAQDDAAVGPKNEGRNQTA